MELEADIENADTTEPTDPIETSTGEHVEGANLPLRPGVGADYKAGWPPLCIASHAGDAQAVKLLLQNGAHVNDSTDDGWTPLNLACYCKSVEVVKLLLHRGADVSISNTFQRSPLMIACLYPSLETVTLLLHHGALVSSTDKAGWTALLAASETGSLVIVRLLLEHGANIEDATNDGETSLMRASIKGHIEVVKLLLERGATTRVCNKYGTSLLLAAVIGGHVGIVRVLLENGADITAQDSQGWTALHSACLVGTAEVVRLLVKHGADVRAPAGRGQTALHIASFGGHVEIVSKLLENGAEIDATDSMKQTPIYLATMQGKVDVLDLLLEKGADITKIYEDGGSLIHLAAARGNVELVKHLLEKGAVLWMGNKDGLTPICLAANNHQVEVVELLLEHGADIKLEDMGGAWVPASPTISGQLVNFLQDLKVKKDAGGHASAGKPQSDILCDTCRRIFLYKRGYVDDYGTFVADELLSFPGAFDMLSTAGFFIHHLTAHSLQSSSAKGCYICRTIWRGVNPLMQQKLLTLDAPALCDEDPRLFLTSFTLMNMSSFLASLGLTFTENEVPEYVMNFVFEGSVSRMLHGSSFSQTSFGLIPSQEAQKYSNCGDLDRSTASKTSFLFAEKCMRTCLENHDKCSASRNPLWLPTRLLCLDKIKDYQTVYLVNSRQVPSVAYSSLSHCWGSIEIPKLTRSTMEAMCHGIPIATLPKTFQDSCYLSHRLGVEYIWIDSLCIIQDDLDDWLKAASQMHLVYENSLCNICATGFPDSSQGIYTTRDPEEFQPCYVDIPWLDNGGKFQVLDTTIWDREILDAPLNKRAWVTQERLLASRHLQFGAKQIFWECLEVTVAEQFPSGVPPVLTVRNRTRTSRDILHQSVDIPSEEERSKILSTSWTAAVEAFMASQLTYSKDKVFAFAGITKKFEALLQEDCDAGLWRKDVECHLLWYVTHCRQGDDSPSVRPTTYRAPSFSWLSVDGCIKLNYSPRKEDVVAEVVSMDLQRSSGIITRGSICIKCPLKALKLERNVSSSGVFWMAAKCEAEISPGFPNSNLVPALVVSMDVDQPYNGVYYGALIRTDFIPSCASGIILQETGKAKGQFERIGSFLAYRQGLESLMSEDDGEGACPSESYDPKEKKYTLSIV